MPENSSFLLIRGGRVIDPGSGVDEIRDLLIEHGRVSPVSVISADPPDGVRVLDAAGLIVSPGFIDLHTHLRFPGFPAKETMASGTSAAAAGGFTTICAMANTDPVVDTVDVLQLVQETAGREAIVRVQQLAAVTERLEGWEITNMTALATAGAIAFSDDGKPVWNTLVMRAALQQSESLGKRISVHEEDPRTVRGGVANAGSIARRLGLPEWPCLGETELVVRDIALLEVTGGLLHIAHVSCADTIDIIRDAKDRGLPVTAEVTPHHLRLTDSLLEGNPSAGLPAAHPCVKVNPPLRSQTDVEAMIGALADGTIDAVATDHAPHTVQDKSGEFEDAAFGFSGIELALPLLLDLVREGRMCLPDVIERLTVGPARVFDLQASLQPGSVADICIFDPEQEWDVTPDSLHSLGKNTPLMSTSLRGRVRWTIVGGQIVHEL